MNTKRKGRRIAASVVIGITTAGIGGAVAWASIPGPDGVIHACYGRAHGQLRVIDSKSGACDKTENPLSWDQHGSPAPVASPGPEGRETSVGSAFFDGTTPKTVASLALSTGRWFVTAKAEANLSPEPAPIFARQPPVFVTCQLDNNGVFDRDIVEVDPHSIITETVALEGIADSARPSTVSLSCVTDTGSAFLSDVKVVAVQLAPLPGGIPE